MSRRLSITIGCLCAVATLIGHDGNSRAARATKAARPSAHTVTYGFATTLVGLSPRALTEQLQAMRATGVTWLRYDLSWAAIQPTAHGPLQWAPFDRVTRAATRAGFHVLMIIEFAPTWAAAPGCTQPPLCSPRRASTYARFAGLAAAHYRRLGVTDWEIWNEPNIAFRFEPAADPHRYVAMLKAAYRAIHGAEPHATVITGGTAPSATDGVDYTPSDWLRALYAGGARGYFDAVAAHPYTFPLTPRQSGPLDAWGQLTTMHALMAARGDGRKPIWITEYGAPTNGPDVAGDHVSEALQATMARQAIALWHHRWSGPLIWYTFQDAGTSTVTSENFYGLVRANGSHKPAYGAFVKAIHSQ